MNLILMLTLLVGVAAGAFDGCPTTGDATGPRTKALDILKNRSTPPATVNPAITLEALLAPRDDRTRWKETDAATITGYVVHVGAGGQETCNCHAKDVAHRDTHIDLALTKGAPRHRSIVVEVSPRWRAAEKMAGVDWSTAALSKLVGKRITVTGWMMLDIEHVSSADNTHKGSGNWRASAWELHPITDLRIEE